VVGKRRLWKLDASGSASQRTYPEAPLYGTSLEVQSPLVPVLASSEPRAEQWSGGIIYRCQTRSNESIL
jgi:hypothetical protein